VSVSTQKYVVLQNRFEREKDMLRVLSGPALTYRCLYVLVHGLVGCASAQCKRYAGGFGVLLTSYECMIVCMCT